MTIEEIEKALSDALSLRSPTFTPDDSSRRKIEALEGYMLQAAQVTGELVEARHWLRLLEVQLADEWETLQGWEVGTSKPRARLTKQDIHEAKIKVAPAKYAAGRHAKMLRESVIDQINRLEREGDRMSRAYTMISGG